MENLACQPSAISLDSSKAAAELRKLAIVITEKIFSVQNSVAKNLCSCEKDLT
jgi:hypothetical protein